MINGNEWNRRPGPDRRKLVKSGAAAAVLLAMPSLLRAQVPDLRIGWLRPLTGPLASSFASLYAAGDIAIEEINAAGGILGRKLVKVEVDDGGAPANQPIAIRQLIENNVNIVVGPVGSSQTRAALAVSTPAKVIQSGFITASEGGDGDQYPYHYQCTFTVAAQAVKYAEFLTTKTSYKNIGVLVEDSAAGSAVLEACRVELQKAGLAIAGSRVAPLRSPDLTPFLRSLRSSGAEALCVFVSNLNDVTQFFVGLDRLGWKPLVVGHTPLVFASVPGTVPASACYPDVYAASYVGLTYTDKEQPNARVRNFVGKLVQLHLPESSLPAAATSPYYDFLHVIAHAAKATRSLDSKDLKAYLDELTNYSGLYGPMSFTRSNHTGYGAEVVAMAQVFAEPSDLLTRSSGLFRPRG